MSKWHEHRRVRVGGTLVMDALSLAANFFLANRTWLGAGVILLAVLSNVFLLWPELKGLRITVPKGTQAEPATWLYLFGIVALGMLIYAGARLYVFAAHDVRRPTTEEFAEPYIHGKYIRLADFADANGTIEGRTFEDSYIYGPVVILAHEGTDISRCFFEGTMDDIFLPIASPTIGSQSGVILVKDCKFRACRFLRVSIIGSPEQVEAWKRQNYTRDKNSN
jgi:hypothetical protein